MPHPNVICRGNANEYARVRRLRLVEARILAMQKLAKELVDASEKGITKSVVDEDTQTELKVLILAMDMLKASKEPMCEPLFAFHDDYAKQFKRPTLVELIVDANKIADCVKLTIHDSLNGQAVPDVRALDLRITETSVKFMEDLAVKLLVEFLTQGEDINSERILNPVQAKQIRQSLDSILKAWNNSKDREDIRTITYEYDQYASTKNWDSMGDAISADLVTIKNVDTALLHECKIWRFDKK